MVNVADLNVGASVVVNAWLLLTVGFLAVPPITIDAFPLVTVVILPSQYVLFTIFVPVDGAVDIVPFVNVPVVAETVAADKVVVIVAELNVGADAVVNA